MGTTLNRHAYQRLIDEDLEWLEKQPRSLEREHIKDIVRLSPNREYDQRCDLCHQPLAFCRCRTIGRITINRETETETFERTTELPSPAHTRSPCAAPVVDEEPVPPQESTLADLAYEAAAFLNESVHMVTERDKQKAQQIAFALRTTISAGNKSDFAYADGYNDGFRQGKQSRAAAATAAPVEQQTFKNTKEAMLYAQRNNIPAVVPVGQSEVPALDCLVHGHEWKQEGSKHFCTHCGTGVDVGPSASPARAAAEEWYTTSATHFEDEQDAIDALAATIKRHCFSAPLDSQDGQC